MPTSEPLLPLDLPQMELFKLWATPMPSDVDGGRTTKGRLRQDETGIRRQVLTSSAEASPARTSPSPERVQVLLASAAAYGRNSPVLLANFDPDTSSWRTSQHSLFEGLTEFSETFPRSGMTRSGTAYLLPPLVLLTGETAYGSLPTPAAVSYGSNQSPSDGAAIRLSLDTMARRQMWPTPTVAERDCTPETMAKRLAYRKKHGRNSVPPYLTDAVKMCPTPTAGDSKASGSRNTPGSKAHAGTSLTDWVRQDGGTGRMWRTPMATDSRGSSGTMKKGKQTQLVDQVKMWPTPSASLGEHAGLVTPTKGREGGTLVEAVSARMMWPTPTSSRSGPEKAKANGEGSTTGLKLASAVQIWPTPTHRDYRFPSLLPYSERGGGTKGEQLPNAAGGPLNPQFVEYLMGYPKDWTDV